jgi:hypothetical protein
MSDPRRPGHPAGEVTLESNADPTVIRVWNFQTSHTELKPHHGPGLIREVIPRIRGRRDRFFVHMIGMASRRGSPQRNQDLAQGRVDNVRNFLIRTLQDMQIPFPESRIPSWIAEGERLATPGEGENSNLDFDRAVEIQITTLEAPTIHVRPLMPPVRDRRDPLPELRLQRRLYIQRVLAGRVQIASIIPGAVSAHVRVSYFTIWDHGRQLACDYFFLGGELRVNVTTLPSVPFGASSTGGFSRIQPIFGSGPITLGVQDFGGKAAVGSGRVGLPSGVQGPGRSGTAFFMYPFIRGGLGQGYFSLLARGGASAGSLSLLALAGTSGDLVISPLGPYLLAGPNPEASAQPGSFDE